MNFSLEKLDHFAIFAFMCYSMTARDLTILSAYTDVRKAFTSWSVNGYKRRQEHKAENNEQSGCQPYPMPAAFMSIIKSQGKCAEGK